MSGKQKTIETIKALLTEWKDEAASENAEAIYQQMPVTLLEMSGGDLPDANFEDLVRLAAHDVRKAEIDQEASADA
jgi:hypothetical protein